jgi:hypothetical protein
MLVDAMLEGQVRLIVERRQLAFRPGEPELIEPIREFGEFVGDIAARFPAHAPALVQGYATMVAQIQQGARVAISRADSGIVVPS